MTALQVARGLAKVEERVSSLNAILKLLTENPNCQDMLKDRSMTTTALEEVIKEIEEKKKQLEAKLEAVEIKQQSLLSPNKEAQDENF